MDKLYMSYREIIKLIEDLKFKLNDDYYIENKEDGLEDAFYKTIFFVWEGLNKLDKEDLTNLYKVHSFLIEEVIGIHRSENSLVNEELMKSNINIRDISSSLEDSKRAFNIGFFNNSNYEYYLIGDIHSDFISVQKILEKIRFFDKVENGEEIRLIFIGDYVDRGKSHFKLLQLILTLKYLFPQNIFLQKGNHDTGSLIDGRVKMGVRKSAKSLEKDWFLMYLYNLVNKNKTLSFEILNKYMRFFDSLTILSFISLEEKTLMIAHAGIPRPRRKEDTFYGYIGSISDLTNIDVRDHLDKTIVNNIIWSDPSGGEKDLRGNKGRFKFTQEEFEEFRRLIGFDVFIRGHQVETKGYNSIFGDRFITIFSSGVILEGDRNINSDTAYTNVSPHIINFNKNGKIVFVDLNA